jgi:hypothetical protein
VREAEFRKIALSLPETFEKSHVGHPDFRVKGGKIFATLGYPEKGYGVLILTADQQGELIGRYPEMFQSVKGGVGKTWKHAGCTRSSEAGRHRIGDENCLGKGSA